jgi:hypothetical protein
MFDHAEGEVARCKNSGIPCAAPASVPREIPALSEEPVLVRLFFFSSDLVANAVSTAVSC